METIHEVLIVLARRYAFRELSYLIGSGGAWPNTRARDAARVQQLCAYGQRLLDLDAEDFANPDAAAGATLDTSIADLVSDELVPAHLIQRGRLCRMRQSPRERPRAALVSLHPAYSLLLEVIALRWYRRETLAVIFAAHIAAEYAPLLAWQPFLGHAGDPLELQQDPSFTGPHSRWGHYDDRECPHTNPQKSAAGRALRVYNEAPAGWRRYLDRQHSSVAQALCVCATTCKVPCAVLTARSPEIRKQVREACRIATAFSGCALVRLRHAAPVGHGFGVPSPAEVAEAWQRSREAIAKVGGLGVAAMIEDGYPLPGLPSLFSAIASTTLTPDTLLADTAAEIVKELNPEGTLVG